MRILNRLFLDDGHSALVAAVRARALSLFMLQDLDARNLGAAVDARNQDVGACCLVLVDFLTDAFSLASAECFTLDGLVGAVLVVVLDVVVRKHGLAAQ